MKKASLFLLLLAFCATNAYSQWTNRYPKVEGFGHHVYLEGFELPIMNAGPMDPAPSPSGDEIAFSSRGWLWVMDYETQTARRITQSPGIDSRPEWSPHGQHIVFIRDDSKQLQIVTVNPDSGNERVLVDEEAIHLDPIYSPDGQSVYYASAVNGPMDLWKVSLDSLHKEPITSNPALQRRPVILEQDSLLVYLHKDGSYNSIELLNTVSDSSQTLAEDRIASQAGLAVSPNGSYLAYTWPDEDDYELRLMNISTPNTSVLLTKSRGLPLAPAFSADGEWIYYTEANDRERMQIKKMSVYGGSPESLTVKNWDWGTKTGTLRITSKVDGNVSPVRMNAVDASGHPLMPDTGAIRSEGQNGRTFFYSDGTVEITAPAGEVTLSAVHGFDTPEIKQKATITPRTTTEITLDLERLWDAEASGWYSGDNHFHLNYGGTYRLNPEDILLDIKAEGLDVAWPLLANLHNRFLQQDLWGWEYRKGPIMHFGQEVRSHFLGHLNLIGIDELFWPWIWGPYYQVYENDDRINATALQYAQEQGGLGGYVHPVSITDPFTKETAGAVPINFVADAVLGEVDLIEVACLWTDEIGTASLWHHILNLGIPLAASAGSDVMTDYYRTMAIGATRAYVKPEGGLSTGSYLRALKEGKSFVSNGPMLEFTVAGSEPGQSISIEKENAEWNLDVHSALPVDSVQIFVNGTPVKTLEGMAEAGSKSYSGSVEIPEGGWITARVLGENTGWPTMDSYLYAETSPVWFGRVGSVDSVAAQKAARELLMVLNVSEQRLKEGYGNTEIPNLLRHFQEAREKLEEIIRE